MRVCASCDARCLAAAARWQNGHPLRGSRGAAAPRLALRGPQAGAILEAATVARARNARAFHLSI
jgi:hypothetical protein